jgi:hypothetical protein
MMAVILNGAGSDELQSAGRTVATALGDVANMIMADARAGAMANSQLYVCAIVAVAVAVVVMSGST